MARSLRKILAAGAMALGIAALAACGGMAPMEQPQRESDFSRIVTPTGGAAQQESAPSSSAVQQMEIPRRVEVVKEKEVVKDGADRGPRGIPGAKGVVRGGAAATQSPAHPASGGEGFNAIGGSATVNDQPYDLTFFQHYGVNPFVDTEDDHLSTFAMDKEYEPPPGIGTMSFYDPATQTFSLTSPDMPHFDKSLYPILTLRLVIQAQEPVAGQVTVWSGI